MLRGQKEREGGQLEKSTLLSPFGLGRLKYLAAKHRVESFSFSRSLFVFSPSTTYPLTFSSSKESLRAGEEGAKHSPCLPISSEQALRPNSFYSGNQGGDERGPCAWGMSMDVMAGIKA